jgi:hypothetical protein
VGCIGVLSGVRDVERTIADARRLRCLAGVVSTAHHR